MKCTHCNSERFVKNGKIKQKQRFLCKNCNKTFYDQEKSRYTDDFKRECLHFYLRGTGIRAIAEVKKMPHSLLIHWIKTAAKNTKEKLRQELEKVEKIDVLEIDELCTYVKKNLLNAQKTKQNIHFYGLLSTEIESKLLILK